MKKRNKFLAGLTAVTVALSSFGMMCVNAISGEELITNGSFERTNTDTLGAVVTELGNTAAISGMEYSTTVGYDDSSSIHITKGGELTTPTKLKLIQGNEYNFSFMIKGTLTSDNGMYIRMSWDNTYTVNTAKLKSDDNGVFDIADGLGSAILKVEAAENGWYKVESTTPWTCSEMEIGFLNVTSDGGTIDFYIDNLSITSTSTADTTGAVISQFGNTSAISGLEYSNVNAYEGRRAIHISSLGNSWPALAYAKNMNMVVGKNYNFSFYIKGLLNSTNGMKVNLGNELNVSFAWLKSDKNGVFYVNQNEGGKVLNVTAAENGWYKVESKTQWTYTAKDYGFLVPATGGGTVDFYIDNFSITDAETGIEMVTDGGFETADIGTEIITNGSFGGHVITDTNGAVITELGNTAAISELEYSTKEAYDGKTSLHISNLKTWPALAYAKNMNMVVGKSYNFSFYIKGLLNSTEGMKVNLGNELNVSYAKLKSDDKGVFYVNPNEGGAILNVTAAENGWYKVESKASWKYTAKDYGFLVPAKEGGTVDFYIDKLSITEEIPDEVIGSFAMSGDTADKTVTINVTNNGYADGYSAILILATYKGDVMQDIAMDDTAAVVEMGGTETLTQTITVNDGETLTAFLWDGLNGMTPLTECDNLITVTTE